VIARLQAVKPSYLVMTVLAVSGFTHIWNAAGFPDLFFDEGVYMRRAMHVLAGLGPQESFFHDHPFFGQIFLASVFYVVGYPASLHASPTAESISGLYAVPRVLMGLLAIADTYLTYKIAEARYGVRVGLISAMFFAVMPMTWVVRRILLDSILMPFLLTSILLAMKSKGARHKSLIALVSGVAMGIAIFTKIPVFAMIPLVAGLAYFGSGKSLKALALFLLPAILIPAAWPIQSLEAGQFDMWLHDVALQAHRPTYGLPYISGMFLRMDPVLFILGVAGAAFAISRRDTLVLMWLVPFLILLLAVGYNQYFYWIPVLPVFCIASSLLIERLVVRNGVEVKKKALLAVVLGIGAFGLASTIALISTDMTSSQFQAAAFVLHLVKENDNETTILASPVYSWVFASAFHRGDVMPDYTQVLWQPVPTRKFLLVADEHYFIDMARGMPVERLFNDSRTVKTFEGNAGRYDTLLYPYTSIKETYGGGHIEVREKG